MDKFKAITGIGAIGLIALIAFLFWQVDRLKDARSSQDRQIQDLEWKLSLSRADLDSIRGLGQYSRPETVWRTRTVTKIDTLSGKIDTVYGDMPDIRGEISFDTTKFFGPGNNPLSVRVAGSFYYPEEFSHKNWLLIMPRFAETPQALLQPRSPALCGIGLTCAFPSQDPPYPGLAVRYGRLSISGLKSVRGRAWMAVGAFEILRF